MGRPLLSVIGQEVTAAGGGGGGVYRPVSKQVGILPFVCVYLQSDRISQRAVPCVCVWVVGGVGCGVAPPAWPDCQHMWRASLLMAILALASGAAAFAAKRVKVNKYAQFSKADEVKP